MEERFRDHDAVLVEWNDQLNARLAVVGAYLGGDVRDFLDEVIYEAVKYASHHLDGLHRDLNKIGPGASLPAGTIGEATEEIARLNRLAYKLGITMMVRVREERVGSAAPGALGEVALLDAER